MHIPNEQLIRRVSLQSLDDPGARAADQLPFITFTYPDLSLILIHVMRPSNHISPFIDS